MDVCVCVRGEGGWGGWAGGGSYVRNQVITKDRNVVRARYVRNQVITKDRNVVRASYVRNQVISTDSRSVMVSYVKNRVITTDSRFEGQLRLNPGDRHRQICGSVISETRWSRRAPPQSSCWPWP